jgi:Flp pilus assembly protein TadG
MRRGIPKRNAGRRAIATVEFALMAPLLLLLLSGVLDYAMLLRTATCAASAARAGIEYGSRNGNTSVDYTGMQNAALNSSPNVSGMTATATRSCQCSGGAPVSCSASCSNGKMMVYVQVTTQVAAHTIFNYSALKFSNLATSRASIRVQ